MTATWTWWGQDLGSKVMSVLLGKGDGTFAASRDYPTGGTPRALVLGDVNEDGHLDVIAVSYESQIVSVLLGKGDGTFAANRDYPTPNLPTSVVLGDLNGDGDLVFGNGDVHSVGLHVRLAVILPGLLCIRQHDGRWRHLLPDVSVLTERSALWRCSSRRRSTRSRC